MFINFLYLIDNFIDSKTAVNTSKAIDDNVCISILCKMLFAVDIKFFTINL